jgi:major membrane immunogen (membrane-anchored lipoprotein)
MILFVGIASLVLTACGGSGGSKDRGNGGTTDTKWDSANWDELKWQ